MNQNLESNWELPNHNFSKDILLATIIHKYGDLPVLETNPTIFKYQSDIWWAKFYRTFEKWFDAFDTPYAPLENYARKEERTIQESEEENTYNKHHHNNRTSSTYIGDSTVDTNVSEEHEDHDSANEVFEGATTGKRITRTEGNVDTKGTKTSDTGIDTEEHSTTDTTTDIDTTQRQTSNNTNTSGRQIPIYDDQGHIIGYTIVENTERSTEHGVSAYDEGANTVQPYDKDNYAPSALDIMHGSVTDSGSANITKNVKTNNAPGANRVTVNADGSKDIDYSENTTGNESSAGYADEHTRGSSDHTQDNLADSHGESHGDSNTRSKATSSDYIDAEHKGNSQQKKDNAVDFTEILYSHGNMDGTPYQSLLKSEIKVQLFTIYDQIAELFVDNNCICIFTSKGGCGLW